MIKQRIHRLLNVYRSGASALKSGLARDIISHKMAKAKNDAKLRRLAQGKGGNIGCWVRVVPVGNNFSLEAELIEKYVHSESLSGRDDVQIINFSIGLRAEVAANPEIIYYRELISDERDVELWAISYEMANTILADITAHPARWRHVLRDTLLHEIARDAYYCVCLEELAASSQSNGNNTIALFQSPLWNPLLVGNLPASWVYVELMEQSQFLPSLVIGGGLADRNFSSNAFEPVGNNNVLLLIDDSINGFNVKVAEQIIKALQAQNAEPIVVTSTQACFDTLSSICQNIHRVEPFVPKRFNDALRQMRNVFITVARSSNKDNKNVRKISWTFFRASVAAKVNSYLDLVCPVFEYLDALRNHVSVGAVIGVNEQQAICATGEAMFRDTTTPTFGVSSILRADTPQNYNWPAKSHLVYGSQLSDIMTMHGGVDERNIQVVGSPYFDRLLLTHLGQDRKTIRQQLHPEANGRKIVMVATENRPRQMLEIEPSMRALGAMESVYTVVKVHPADDINQFIDLYKALGSPENMAIKKGGDIGEYILSSDLLLSMRSNVIIEAAVLGVPAIVTNFTNTWFPLDFAEEGLCPIARSVDDLPELVEKVLFDDDFKETADGHLANISSFNGPNDGLSAERVATAVISTLGNGN